jgi:hypothetical protein
MNENFEGYSNLIEEALTTLGVNKENARCSEPGQWLIFNGETEVYVDLWEQKTDSGWNYFQPEGYNLHVFQVLAPICKLPEGDDMLQAFYEDLLQNNLNLLFASYIINKDEQMLAVKFRRICNAIKLEDVIEAIESVGFYAELTRGVLTQKYGVDPIQLDQEK